MHISNRLAPAMQPIDGNTQISEEPGLDTDNLSQIGQQMSQLAPQSPEAQAMAEDEAQEARQETASLDGMIQSFQSGMATVVGETGPQGQDQPPVPHHGFRIRV